MKDFKVNFIKEFKILKNRLVKNKAFIDVMLKIIATFATILLTFQANQILKQQNTINELEIERNFMEVAPAFSFFKNSDNKYTYYEMINSKGFISNVTFEKIDIISFYPINYVQGPTNNVPIPKKMIIDFSKFGSVNEKSSNSWSIKDDTFISTDNFAREVVGKVNSSSDSNEFHYLLKSYYHITYNDFQNIQKEEYYDILFDGTGRYTDQYYLAEDFVKQHENYLKDTKREFIFVKDKTNYTNIVDVAVKEIQDYSNE